MIIVTVAGNTGKDAEYKKTQNGTEFCKFSLAGTIGYGDSKQTLWFDVTKWGKGAEGLAKCILKGTKLTVSGELSQREYEGKTYLQIRADHVALQGERQGGGQSDNRHRNQDGFGGSTGGGGGSPAYQDEMDDSVPFLSANPALERRVG